ncbi:hypothetical protein BSNK01_06190 [Bacillaceae bacterium]
MKTKDYLIFLTERLVTFLETPRKERGRRVKEPWSTRWFGMIPFSLKMLLRK